ncbi:MAG: NAD-dependent epimerase/dehydratase family protein [Chloroflexi bacterium]|nr:NAD-dependent epimerase/dehydratase family protein [Chloroflexota bacterium]
MNVLFIGGTRDFGRITVKRMLERGDNVTLYTRGNAKPDFWDDVGHIIGDRTDHEQFVKNLKGKKFDAVIDNVAYYVEDVKAAVEALRGNVGKYLVSSTASVYGGPGHAKPRRTLRKPPGPRSQDEFVDLAANAPLREECLDLTTVSWDFDPSRDKYAEGKRQIERLLSETPDFPWVVMRIPTVLGPAEAADRFWFYLQRIQDGREMILRDGGTSVFRPGFRDDVGGAFIDAIGSPRAVNEIYNVTGADIVTLRRFVQIIADKAGKPLNTVSVPGDIIERTTDLPYEDWWYDFMSQPPVYIPSIEKARLHFELKTTPIEDWVGETVAWYTQNRQPDSKGYKQHRDTEVALCKRWRDGYGKFVQGFVS